MHTQYSVRLISMKKYFMEFSALSPIEICCHLCLGHGYHPDLSHNYHFGDSLCISMFYVFLFLISLPHFYWYLYPLRIF